jgi:hypothetical protein
MNIIENPMKSNRKLILTIIFSVCAIALFGVIQTAEAQETTSVNGPVVNPYLASPLYAITHFDSSQSDSTPYGPPNGVFTVDLTKRPIVYGGPINIMTLASTNKNYMWGVGTDRVSYINKADNNWTAVAKYEALADASKGTFPAIPDENLSTFGESSAVGMNTSSMDSFLKNLFGENYADRVWNGIYSLVDKDNVLYVNYNGSSVYAFALSDSNEPSKGITKRYALEDTVTAIQGNNHQANITIAGLSMTYDGHVVITFSNGVAVIDRDLNASSASFRKFGDDESITNSIAIDENNGIYVASNTIMRKLVWTGTTLSENVADGAWSCPYTHSVQPPAGKHGNGTGSTPTLMGFGNDPDKLVVITDGAKQMNLVAFWRDNIPPGSQRIAGQIPVTCGFSPLPEWIQSEASVVVYGYGAFVANEIPETISPDLEGQNLMLNLTLVGPAYPGPYGVERFQWNTSTHQWSSVWARSDVETSTGPSHSQSGNMALFPGYRLPYGWEVLGLDWDTGKTMHHTIFGDKNFGNPAYAVPLEYFENGDLVLNSIVGPIRIHYDIHPSLMIDNSVDPKTYFAVGDLLDYDYTVTNTGNVDITGPITVKDDMFGSKKISYNGLAPGQSVTGKASHLVTPSDIYAGFKSNSAYATGSFANKEVTSNSDTATTRFFGPNANLYPTIYYS